MTVDRHNGHGGERRRRALRHRPGYLLEGEVVASPPRRPLVLAELVGRRREAAELVSLAVTERLVSVTGPPGVGKSALARHVAAALVEPRRVCLVDLDPVTDPAAVLEAVRAQMGASRHGDALAAVAASVGDAPDVVVLDNCEHVVGGCGVAVEALLASCSRLRIMATSREALGLPGEVVMALAPLSLPAAEEDVANAYLGSEAVQLFCERAVAARPSFVLDAATAPAVVEVCRRLDGVALAIELAAARLAALTLPEILDRLDDRFTLLASPLRRGPRRAQSLRAALDVSYDLLSGPQRAVLARLSVFAGGWTTDAAEDVCAGGQVHPDAVVDLLNALVAKSLVGAHVTVAGTRYRMLDSVRAFAWSRLAAAGECAVLPARHARWCVELLDRASHGAAAPGPTWQADVEPEEANISAALTWAVGDGNVRVAANLVGRAVSQWWSQGRYAQAQRWLQEVLRLRGRIPPPLRVKLLCDAAHGAVMVGDFTAAHAHATEALVVAREQADPRGVTESLKLLGFMTTLAGDPDRGLALIDEAVRVAESAGDVSGAAHALAARARTHMFRGHAAGGRADFEESLALAEGFDPVAAVNARVGMGWAALWLGDYEDAQAQLDSALTSARRAGDRHVTALALAWLGEVHRRRGDDDAARADLAESSAVAREVGTPHPLALSLLSLGCLAGPTDDEGRAPLEEALSIARTSVPVLVPPCLVALGELELAGGKLADARRLLDEALATARSHSDEANEAAALFALGVLARAEGDEKTAESLDHEALRLRTGVGDPSGVADSLEALGGLLSARGELDVASRLLGAGESVRTALGCVRLAIHQTRYKADVATLRDALGEEAFDSAWRQGAALSMEEAVVYASRGRGRRASATVGWQSLTPSELQVVELVAGGLTNPQVADRLFVSARTVQTHLRHIFAKLGVSSRTALAAEAIRRRP